MTATPAQIASIIAMLQAAYPNYSPAAETPTVFMTILSDLPADLLKAATLKIIGEPREFAPSVGTIRDAALKIKAQAQGYPSASEAYREVCDMPPSMEKSRTEETEAGWVIFKMKLCFSHPFVENIARLIGWPKQFPTDNPTADRAQFLKMYESELAREVSRSNEIPQVLAYLEKEKQLALPAQNEIKKLSNKLGG